jgi:hypothetical protein
MDALPALQISWSATMDDVCLLTPTVKPTLVLLVLNASPSTVSLVECVSKIKEDASTTQQASVPVQEITSLVAMVGVLSWDVAHMTITTTVSHASPPSRSIVLEDFALSPSARLIPRPPAGLVSQVIAYSMESASKLTYTVHHTTTMAFVLLVRPVSS